MSADTDALRTALRPIGHWWSDDDPLNQSDICDGCKEDWPCPFVQGYAAAAMPEAINAPANADWLTSARLLDAVQYLSAASPQSIDGMPFTEIGDILRDRLTSGGFDRRQAAVARFGSLAKEADPITDGRAALRAKGQA